MKTIILITCVTLAGCGSYLADKSAQDSCSYYIKGTSAYANCYAAAYQNERANLSAYGAAMMQAKPFGTPTYTTPVYIPTYNRPLTCQIFGGPGTNYQRTTTCY